MKKFFGIFLISTLLFGCTAQQIQDTVSAVLGSTQGDPTEAEAGNGLKDALSMGITKGMGLLSQTDGFLGGNKTNDCNGCYTNYYWWKWCWYCLLKKKRQHLY